MRLYYDTKHGHLVTGAGQIIEEISITDINVRFNRTNRADPYQSMVINLQLKVESDFLDPPPIRQGLI